MTLIEVVRGRDGKRYPSGLPRPRAEVVRLRWLAHQLVCVRGLTIRAAQDALLAEHGIRRSRGAIHKDVQRFECPQCAGPVAGDG